MNESATRIALFRSNRSQAVRLPIVVTGNLREFERVAGLRCEDWEATG